MKNVQVIDGAVNAAFTIFAVTEDEFKLIFPDDGRNIEIIEDMVERLGDDRVGDLMKPVWDREIPKTKVYGFTVRCSTECQKERNITKTSKSQSSTGSW